MLWEWRLLQSQNPDMLRWHSLRSVSRSKALVNERLRNNKQGFIYLGIKGRHCA